MKAKGIIPGLAGVVDAVIKTLSYQQQKARRLKAYGYRLFMHHVTCMHRNYFFAARFKTRNMIYPYSNLDDDETVSGCLNQMAPSSPARNDDVLTRAEVFSGSVTSYGNSRARQVWLNNHDQLCGGSKVSATSSISHLLVHTPLVLSCIEAMIRCHVCRVQGEPRVSSKGGMQSVLR